jgi:hypothetical protein
MRRTRKIGLGAMGLAELFARVGMTAARARSADLLMKVSPPCAD